jgi:4-diphosphocytidyl-2-C-methyl-D-erythritol kinase
MDTACAAVTGRGEILSHLTPRTDFSLVVVDPGFPVSTKEAYARLDDSRSGARAPGGRSAEELRVGLDRAIREYASLPPSAWSFENDFFHAVARVHPDLVECRAALVSAGASFSAMSGSGSALFGVFEYLDVAERALEAISKAYSAVIAFPLARLRDSI